MFGLLLTFFIMYLGFSLASIDKNTVPEERPRITQHPRNTTVVKNRPLTLDCRVTGFPKPKIDWYRDGKLVITATDDPTSHRILLPGGSLFFLRAVQSKKNQDSGIYWCQASNSVGVVRSKNATVEIAYMRDEFRAVPINSESTLGKDIVMICSAPRGYPLPVIKWKKNGDNLDLTSSKRIKIDENGNLKISSVVKQDSGQYQCSAENVAGHKLSKPAQLSIHESPFFVNRPPPSVTIVRGEDLLIECSVGGDPQPDIEWTREGGVDDIDVTRTRIVEGKGLQIKDVHPEDGGTYYCKATSGVGSILAQTMLTVREPPLISVQPPTSVQVAAKQPVALECLVTGSPKPLTFWMKEGNIKLYNTNSQKDGIRITRDGTLNIDEPSLVDSGFYTCITLNSVGTAIATSQLRVYDTNNDQGYLHQLAINAADEDFNMETFTARRSTGDESIVITEALPSGPRSIKIAWECFANKDSLVGFLMRYRRTSDIEGEFKTISILDDVNVNTFELKNLNENTMYDIFVQTYSHGGIVGRPTSISQVLTHQDKPSQAPTINKALLLNQTTIFLSWQSIERENHNGPLLGYKIEIKGNASSVNNTIDPLVNQVHLIVEGMVPYQIYTIQIAAFNEAGIGPLSFPVKVELDPSFYGHRIVVHGKSHDLAVWTVAIISAFSLILIFISGIVYYKRNVVALHKNPMGKYLAANTSDEFNSGVTIAHQIYCDSKMNNDNESLWIDRGWKSLNDYEKQSNSSEKKLLAHSSNSNSETEYAYVDKLNIASFAMAPETKLTSESPEPYATTDIFKPTIEDQQMFVPSSSCIRQHYHQQQKGHYAACKVYPGPYSVRQREAQSCDDLSTSDGCCHQPPVCRSVKQRPRQNKTLRSAADILGNIPPPLLNPPPPTPGLMSPKFLFSHPLYQSADKHLGRRTSASAKHSYRVTPCGYDVNHYHRNKTEENEEEEPFIRIIQPHASYHHIYQYPHFKGPEDTKWQQRMSISDAERDFQNELNSFEETVTQFKNSDLRRNILSRKRKSCASDISYDGGLESEES